MRKFKLSPDQYAAKLEKENGFASKILVDEYTIARTEDKRRMIAESKAVAKGEDPLKGVNLITNDPKCKTCRKTKAKS